MTFPGRLEAAIGADRAANAYTWTYTDLTPDIQQHEGALGGGRGPEAVNPDPGSLTVTLDNSTGKYTPRLATSSLYPGWGRGVPLRYSVKGASRFLMSGAAGGKASTPDAASLDITGDLWIAAEVWAPLASPKPGFGLEVGGKYDTGGNQRSYLLSIGADAKLTVFWSTDGTSAGQLSAAMTTSVDQPGAGPYAFGAFLDVNNLAGGRTTKFYGMRGTLAQLRAAITAADPAVLLETVTASGTTSIFAGTASLIVGDVGTAFDPYPGQIRAFEVRSGDHTGTIVANPDFTIQTAGAGSFADTAAVPKTWTIAAPSSITDYHPRALLETNVVAPRWPGHGVSAGATCQVTASGVLRRQRQGEEALHSAIYRRVTDARNIGNIHGYWPWEDGSEATRFTSPIAGALAMSFSGFQAGADNNIEGAAPLPLLSDNTAGSWAGKVPATTPTTAWALEFFFYMPTPETSPAGTRLFALNTSGGPVIRWASAVDDTNITLTGRDDTGTAIVNASTASDPLFFSQPSYVRLDVVQNGGNVDYTYTLIPLNRSGGGFTLFSASTGGVAGRPTRLYNSITSGPPGGLAMGQWIISSGLALGWLAQAETAFDGENPVARIARLFAEEDIPIAVHGPRSGGTVTMGPQRPLALSALVEEAAAADGGILSEQRGQLGMHYRGHTTMLNQPVRWTIGSGLILPFEPSDDDQTLRNVVTAQRPNGISATATDAASVAKDGKYTDSPTVNVETDDQVPQQAGWRTHLATWPDMRLRAATIELAKDISLVEGWLGTALGDRVSITDPPAFYPTQTIEQQPTGYAETIGEFLWTVAPSMQPDGPWQVGELDTDGTPDTSMRRLTATGATLTASLNTSATSFSVATPAGEQLWTTTAGHFPLDIDIDGERIRLSAISGASSPQTFTASARSVNGVVKSHSSGAAVQVADPLLLAL